MTPTDDLRNELRELLDEAIPELGTEADTAFTTARIDALLKAAPDIYSAAAEGWRRKAAKVQKRLGDIAQSSVGDTSYQRITLGDALKAALAMADMFQAMSDKVSGGTGGVMVRVTPPEVL